MKNILYILACLAVALVLGSSYCEGTCAFRCKCKCHDGLEACKEFCWMCAHTHHEDCECGCHDDSSMECYYKDYNDFCRRRACDNCLWYHCSREIATDYGMQKGLIPKKQPYLHPIKDYPSLLHSFDADCCE